MLSMMVDLEEDEDWALADELEDDDFDRSVWCHDSVWLYLKEFWCPCQLCLGQTAHHSLFISVILYTCDHYWCMIVACLWWRFNIFPMFSNSVAGESALDRIACGLGGKIVLPMIKQHIMQMLQNRKEQTLYFKRSQSIQSQQDFVEIFCDWFLL